MTTETMFETGFVLLPRSIELERFESLQRETKASGPRKRLEQRWTRAIIAGRWRLADILFDHLWPGVFDLEHSPLWAEGWD